MGERRVGAILSAVGRWWENWYFGVIWSVFFLFLFRGFILQEKAYVVFGQFYGKEEIKRGLFLSLVHLGLNFCSHSFLFCLDQLFVINVGPNYVWIMNIEEIMFSLCFWDMRPSVWLEQWRKARAGVMHILVHVSQLWYTNSQGDRKVFEIQLPTLLQCFGI